MPCTSGAMVDSGVRIFQSNTTNVGSNYVMMMRKPLDEHDLWKRDLVVLGVRNRTANGQGEFDSSLWVSFAHWALRHRFLEIQKVSTDRANP